MDKAGLKNKLRTIAWGFKTCWQLDKKPLLFWYALTAVLSVLPAVALRFNQRSLSIISGFLSGEAYTYKDAVPAILALGILLTVVGLSSRVNLGLVFFMMYESYYMGFAELIMDNIQRIEMTDLLKKDINDAWNFCYLRGGSLADFVSGACMILAKLVSIVSLLIVAFGTSRIIFFMSLIYVVGVFVLNMLTMGKTRRALLESFQEERMIEYYEQLSENPAMAKETRVYENTDEVITQWEKPFGRGQKRERYRIFQGELRDFIGGAGFYLFLIAAVGISLFGVAKGTMTPDVFLVLFFLCLNIYNTITGAAGSLYRFDDGLDAMDKQRHFFEIAPMHDPESDLEKADTPGDEDTVFEVRNLTFHYSEDKRALNNVSFTVKKGELVALVGQNGSGKSTLIKLLLSMYRPTSGAVKVMGREYGEYKRDYIRQKIGVFFQNYYLFHSTLRENVGVGAVEEINNEEKILKAIKRGGAEKLVSNLTKGLDTLLGKFQDKSGTELSGGEKQRVAAARTHMSDRDILIFDEPASMLDPIAEMEQFTNIK
ncbi:MAG: ABC transporter ATP-binding protein [Clostridiales bacterium]|nr:ABC transporter ATP-binding protein [Clostridiales bacterium]